jgi:iron complex outermembrane receptor protein
VIDPIAPDRAKDDPTFDLWSPKASLTWLFRPDSSVYFAYARGFRIPNFDEDAPLLGYPPGSPPTIPDLDPQKSDSIEIGAKHFGERVEAGVSAYVMWVENEITYDPFTFANVNFDEVRHIGVETSLAVQLLDWLVWSGSYTWEDVEIRDYDADPSLEGEKMPITPRHRGTVGLFADLPWDVEAGATANLVGARIFANDFDRQLSKMAFYATLDLHFAWRPELGEHVRGGLTFALRNVTGEKYPGFGARYDLAGGTVPTKFYNPAPRRTWEVGFVLEWKSQ